MKWKFARALLSMLLVAAMALGWLPGSARAAEIANGTCGADGDGSNLIWSLDDEGTLTISGTGKMADYETSDTNKSPWYSSTNIKSAIVGDGVTSIGAYAFYACDSLTRIIIPESMTSIGENAFYDCSELKDVYYRGSKGEWDNLKIWDETNSLGINTGNTDLTDAYIHYNSSGDWSTESTTQPTSSSTTELPETTTEPPEETESSEETETTAPTYNTEPDPPTEPTSFTDPPGNNPSGNISSGDRPSGTVL